METIEITLARVLVFFLSLLGLSGRLVPDYRDITDKIGEVSNDEGL